VTRARISRRALLAGAAAAAGSACARKKATAFQGYCFIANQGSRSVSALDLSSFKVRKHIALDASPASVIPHPSATRVFALAPENGTVYEIDGVTLAVTRRAKAGNTAAQMQFSPRRNALWVLYRDPPSLVELPLATLRPGRRIRLAAAPDSFDISVSGLAAVAMPAGGAIALASLESAKLERTIETGVDPSIVRFQGDGRQILVGSRPQRSLSIFETSSGKVVVRLPLPVEPRHFAFNADYGQLFISGDGMDAVVHVYPYRTEIAETMLAGHAPDAMAVTGTVDAGPTFLLVANPDTNSVTILDFDSMGKKLVAAVQVGQEPRYILVTPDQQYALVLNRTSGDVAVIRIPPLASQDFTRRYKPSPLFTMVSVGEWPVSAAVVAFS
jgi:DNA-binding beta-propeller fold protein YncE